MNEAKRGGKSMLGREQLRQETAGENPPRKEHAWQEAG